MREPKIEQLTSSDFEVRTRKPKILFFDIESAPLTMTAWKWWETTGLWLEHDWFMLSWSAKWLGGKHITKCLADYEGYQPGSHDDSHLVSELWQMLGDADVLVGHNVDRFDIRKTRTRAILNGKPSLPKFQTVDTFKIAKREFAFTQNSLDALAGYLGVSERKLETGGKQLWRDCMAGDPKAWTKMKRYNRQDVVVTEKVYLELRGWTQTHPNLAVMQDLENGCRNCGSRSLRKQGMKITATGKRQNWQCKDCGAWMQGSHIPVTTIR